MRVAFVVNDLQLSGGVGVVVEHARQLTAAHGFDVDLVLAREQDDPDWRYPGLRDIGIQGLDKALNRRYDVVVATWWETVAAALEISASRHAYFVQSLEDRFYRADQPERIGAALTHDLPLHVITEARWIAETLEQVFAGRRCFLVRNGVAKDIFVAPAMPPVRRGEPLRILVEGDRDVWFKGVGEALAATRAMSQPRAVTLVARTDEPVDGARVLGPRTMAQMAQLYLESDVVLKLSRVEGMFGPPLEGFHCGATCVVSSVTGHDEYVVHGHNGLVVGWDDERGCSRALDLLATDRELLHRLRWNALVTARAWPSWEQSGAMMATALHAVARTPQPDGRGSSLATVSDARAAIATQALHLAERSRLEYRAAPLLALEARLARTPRWLLAPPRMLWNGIRRVLLRRTR